MMNVKISVLFKSSNLTSEIITNIIKRWPRGLHYIIQSELDTAFDKKFGSTKISITRKSLALEILKSTNPDWVILLNDESSISIPDIEYIIHKLDHKNIGIVAPQKISATQHPIYSPDKSTTPDHFLSSVVIPIKYLDLISTEILLNSNRWLGHDVALFCLSKNINYELMPYQDFFMPTPNVIKGNHIIKNRIFAKSTITTAATVFSDKYSMPAWVTKNHKIYELINALPEKTTLSNVDLEAKKIIDDHLSELTLYLYEHATTKQYKEKNEKRISLKDKKVAIFRVDAIGDFIIATPIIEAILSSKPKEVCIITTNTVASLYKNDKRINKIVSFDEQRKISITTTNTYKTMTDDLCFLAGEVQDYDIAILPKYHPDFSFCHHLQLLLGIPVRVGIKNIAPQEGDYINPMYDGMLTHYCQPLHEQHEVEKINSLSTVLNIKKPLQRLFIPVNSHSNHYNGNLINCKYIVFGMGAMSLNRRYPIEKVLEFLQLAENNIITKSIRIVFVGGNDIPNYESTFDNKINIINFIGKINLAQSAELISNATAYIGNDSGTMHIAAALNIPCIEISMHPKTGDLWHVNSPMRFGPWGVRCVILQPEKALEDKCRNGCIENYPHCIKQIKPESIMQALINIINQE